MANIPEKSNKLYNFSNKKQIKLIISNFRFWAVKTQRIKKRDKTCYRKKLQNLKKKHRIGYNPIKPGNLFKFLFSVFS